VAVGHFHFDAHLFFSRDHAEAFLVTIERVMHIVRAIYPEDRHAAAWQQAGRIVGFHPCLAAVAELVDGWLLHGFTLVEKSAPIDGHCRFEAIVERGNEAGSVAAPTDACHCGVIGIDFGK
jgi:hypothetical protein